MMKLSSFLSASFTLCLAVFLCPGEAWAWGPGVHMVISNWVLQNLATLPTHIAEPIMLFPGQFIYGCLSADIFIGKGSKPKAGHSHNWTTGFTLLQKSHTARRMAYAQGYLSHLAADTVAHNVYIPDNFHKAPGLGRLAHVYLEMQADRLMPWDSRDAINVFREAPSKAAERMLRVTMGQSSLAFWLKKHLYLGSIAIGGKQSWKRSLNALDALFPEHERKEILQYLLTISTRAVLDVLANGSASGVCTLDPIGAEALLTAQLQGKKLFPAFAAHAETTANFTPNRQSHPANTTATRSAGDVKHQPSHTPSRVRLPDALASLPPICGS